jgi:alpha-beta hydrolase superfamily lysophospholipase
MVLWETGLHKMIRLSGRIASFTFALAFALAASPAFAERGHASETLQLAQAPERTGHVYLLRGLMNVFSLGMDSLGQKLRAQGVPASVHHHSAWSRLAGTIKDRHGDARRHPVIIVGHSLGADAAVRLAERLAETQVPVALLVTFDPVNHLKAPPNVQRFVNFYLSGGGWGHPVERAEGFRGNLVNRDLRGQADVSHTSIDKRDELHDEIVREVLRITRRR